MHKDEGRLIEHNPYEKPQPWWLWWVGWAFVGVVWVSYLMTHGPDWHSLAVGGLTGIMLVSWVADIAGLDTPESWRRKPRRRR